MSDPEHTPAGPATRRPSPQRRRPSLWRALFYAASTAVIAWAALVVPLPFIEYVPGPPTEIPPLVEIDGAATTELDGSTSLLTVLLRQQPTFPAVVALIDGQRRLLHVNQVFPADVGREEHLEQQRERFGRQFEVAAAVGARAAGVETELVTEAVVLDVMPGTPADGTLQPGDAVLAVDGDRVIAAEELQARAREGEVGDELTLRVRRDGEEIDVAVTLGESPEVDWPVIGILIETAVDELRLPFDLRLADNTQIGGPSAGLMVAITVYDLLADENLLRGRALMGTGTVDADGRVGTVGGVPEKMLAAARHGADLVLVPEPQLDVAREGAPDDLEVIGVSTFEEALDALRGSG